MAPRKSLKNIVAKLVTGKKEPCAFCCREVDDELLYGKLYAIGGIQCHYYCVLLSSCLIQKGRDEQGLFGFIYEDILTEVERCKKHKCSYCSQVGANLGCSVSQCRKQFHLPCGKEKNCMSLFYGNYKTFCQNHAPKQKIPEQIMKKAKLRRITDNKAKKTECNFKDLKELSLNDSTNDANESDTQSVCVICYEPVEGYPTPHTFWPPCCARDAWFHRTCLQRMALSAGMHYLKCPLCNDKEHFYEAVLSQGFYVPDRDAAWELEQNAYAEIYERPVTCSATECGCPMGRSHDADNGAWSISICLLCGSSGQHEACLPGASSPHMFVCTVCSPAAPDDLHHLANSIQAVISEEESRSSRRRHGPVMPSRMSLRRTKRNVNMPTASCSTSQTVLKPETELQTPTRNTEESRELLNLKTPKLSRQSPNKLKLYSKSTYESPTRILEDSLKDKISGEVKQELVEKLRNKFKKPQPLSVKKKIVDEILNDFFDNLLQERKQKEPIKQYNSPKKCTEMDQDVEIIQTPQEIIDLTTKEETNTQYFKEIPFPTFNTPTKLKTVDIEKDSSLEISANNEIVNIDVFKINSEQEKHNFMTNIDLNLNKCAFKFSPCNDTAENNDVNLDIETFKNQYLSEVKKNKENRKRKNKDKIVLTYEEKRKRTKQRSISIKNKDIQVKIKWRKEQLKLQFDNIKNKKKNKKFRQYVLQYSPEKAPNIGKPEIDVTPKKRKYVKQEKSPDNLVQTSLEKFFKIKSPGKE
ncbi:uncharacterized protein LOC142985567 [Anticarsia gemmatalis]|uniref:uncharacterized protein LOC142985567 n=1 Tax=Anticarsia gemmatalis TaxID=129554 RepID=UPI003F75FD59